MNRHAQYAAVARQGEQDLVVQHAPLVKRIANHLIYRLPSSVQLDDLIQAGMIGLLEASRQYDPTQGASFESYAGIRIRGAMLDEIRRGDWTPRSVHRRSREVGGVITKLENQLGREPRDVEICDAMGISLEEYHKIMQDATGAKIFSYDQYDDEDSEPMEFADGTGHPGEHIQRESFMRSLSAAIAALPEREKLFMALYYDEELNLREIGEVLGVSESRACQIHGQALVRIKSRMAAWIENEGD
jgi:RNA polymerase sigma factor FliA